MSTAISETETSGSARRGRKAAADAVPVVAAEPVATVVEPTSTVETVDKPSVPSSNALAQLMSCALAGRRRMVAAQDKLRAMESEIRASDGDKRSRFERLRAAALSEYRSAKADAERARRQLATSMRMLPGRS